MPVRGIVNDKMQKVRFKENKDGSLEWDKKATPDIIKIGNAMARTKTGLVQLKKLDEAKFPIQMKINYSLNGRYGFFQPRRASTRSETYIDKATLYIFENEIKEYTIDIHGIINIRGDILVKESRLVDLQDAYAYLGWYEVLLGITASHEAEHSEVCNIQLSEDNDDPEKSKYEKSWKVIPYKISLRVAEEEYSSLTPAEKLLVDNFISTY